MKLKEDIEGKLLKNKAGALCLRERGNRWECRIIPKILCSA